MTGPIRRPVVWAVLAAALAAPAAAAGQEPAPVEGAGSFAQAPVLAPGTYADTIQQGETLFYAVDLERGQRLTASVTVRGQEGVPEPDRQAQLEVAVLTPTRERDVLGSKEPSFRGSGDVTAEVATAAVDEGDVLFDRPGRHFLAVELTAGERRLGGRDFALSITVAVEQVGPGPTTTTVTTVAATTAPPATSPAPPPDPAEAGGGISPAVAAACFVGGAAGGSGGYWLRRRRRPAAPVDPPAGGPGGD